MRDLKAGSIRYRLAGSDCEIALSHAIGCAFVELQQLEFTIISYLSSLAGGSVSEGEQFDVFSSKTFGNLLHEMNRHAFLMPLVKDLLSVKKRRDFFIHKFLFHRFGGREFTLDEEFEVLIRDAAEICGVFSAARTHFHDFMLQEAPLKMFAIKLDPDTGEFVVKESEFSKGSDKPEAIADNSQ